MSLEITYAIERYSFSKDVFDGNEDIFVKFVNGYRYVATFFTYKNIESLRQKKQKTGEELSGKYFWASDMILINDLRTETIKNVIDDLIKDCSFKSFFSKIKKENLD